MSDTTDDMKCGATLYEAHLDNLNKLCNKKIWVTGRGDKIKVKDLTRYHLLNIIKRIENKTIIFPTEYLKKSWLLVLNKENDKRDVRYNRKLESINRLCEKD